VKETSGATGLELGKYRKLHFVSNASLATCKFGMVLNNNVFANLEASDILLVNENNRVVKVSV
jgi:hypothetical protein